LNFPILSLVGWWKPNLPLPQNVLRTNKLQVVPHPKEIGYKFDPVKTIQKSRFNGNFLFREPVARFAAEKNKAFSSAKFVRRTRFRACSRAVYDQRAE